MQDSVGYTIYVDFDRLLNPIGIYIQLLVAYTIYADFDILLKPIASAASSYKSYYIVKQLIIFYVVALMSLSEQVEDL